MIFSEGLGLVLMPTGETTLAQPHLTAACFRTLFAERSDLLGGCAVELMCLVLDGFIVAAECFLSFFDLCQLCVLEGASAEAAPASIQSFLGVIVLANLSQA